MSTPSTPSFGLRLSLLGAVVLGSIVAGRLSPEVRAQSIWNGGGGDNNWSTGANWQGGTAPTSSTSTAIQFAGTTRLTTNIDSAFTVGSLTFNSGAGDFTLVGSPLTLADGGTVTKNSGSFFTNIANGGVTLGGASTWNISSGYLTVSAQISGGGSLTKSGAGELWLSGTNTYSGGTTLNSGTLRVATSTALGTGSLTINGGSLSMNTSVATSNAQFWNGSFRLISFNSTGAITLGGNLAIEVYGGGQVVAGAIGDGGHGYGLTVTANPLTLTGANTYSGPTVVDGHLDFGQRVSLYNANTAAWTATNLVVNGTATFRVGGTGEFTAADIDQLATLGTATGGFKSGSYLGLDTTHAAGGSFTYDGNIANPNGGANTLGLFVTGGNTLILRGTQSYTGTTVVESSTLQLGDSTHTATLAGNVQINNGTLDIVNANLGPATAVSDGGFGAGNVQLHGSGSAGSASFDVGTMEFHDSSTAGHAAINVSNQLNFFDQSTAGNASITTSPGGNTQISFFDQSTGGNAAIEVNSATLSIGGINSSSFSLGALAGDGEVGLGSKQLTVGSLNTSSTFSGRIVDFPNGGSLVKTGTGTLTLSGNNTYTGGTTVNGGTLLIDGSLTQSAVTVNSGGTLGGRGSFGGSVAIATGGHLAPGNSPGTITFTHGLSLAAGCALDFQLGTTSDLIRVTSGTLSGPASGTITLNIFNAGGFTAGTYTLFDFTGATLSDFDLSDFGFGTTLPGYDYSLAFNGSMLELTAIAGGGGGAIPEPSTYAAIFGACALGLAAWRRRVGSQTIRT